MIKITVFLVLAMHFLTAVASDVSLRHCSDASSHVEQRRCLEFLFKKTDARLVHAEEIAIAKLAAWDEDPEYRSKSTKALLTSNAAFRKYRANECDYVWTLAAGGNGATDMKLSCAIELSENRVKQLETYSHGVEAR